jgi:hypothetical protein
MPKKTEPQSIGEVGVASVASALVNAGWSVDQVHSDYGEDLIAQTFLKGIADPFRIYVQVKSSRKHVNLSLRRDHLRKWLGSIDLFLIVLWDVSECHGHYFIPADKWNLGDLLFNPTGKFSVAKSDWYPLSPEHISRIEWESRIRGWNLLFLDNKSRTFNIDDELMSSDGISDAFESINKTTTYIVFKLLEFLDLGEHGDDRIILKTLEIWATKIIIQDYLRAAAGQSELVSLGLSLEQSIFLIILWRMSMVAPLVGLPGAFLEEAVRLVKFLAVHQAREAVSAGGHQVDDADLEEFFCV